MKSPTCRKVGMESHGFLVYSWAANIVSLNAYVIIFRCTYKFRSFLFLSLKRYYHEKFGYSVSSALIPFLLSLYKMAESIFLPKLEFRNEKSHNTTFCHVAIYLYKSLCRR